MMKNNRNRKIVELRDSGWTFTEIAKKFNRSKTLIGYIYRREKEREDDEYSDKWRGLPVRIINSLKKAGLTLYKAPEKRY